MGVLTNRNSKLKVPVTIYVDSQTALEMSDLDLFPETIGQIFLERNLLE